MHAAPGLCSTSNFDEDLGYFVQDTSDDFNWQRRRSSTPSTLTGPDVDCNTGSSTGKAIGILTCIHFAVCIEI